jgi:hypothetical protein
MPRGQPLEETTAVDVPGFPEILWTVAQRVLGSTQRPEYEVYEEPLSGTLQEYWAEVQIYLNREARDALFRISGRPMPTPRQAIKMAAWEAIAQLRHQLHRMNRRAFRFYPSRATLEGDTFFSSTDQEEDVAVVHLTRYVSAQHDLIGQLVDSLAMARRAVAHFHNLRTQPSSPVGPQSAVVSTSVPAEPLLGIPVVERHAHHMSASTLDYLRLFATYSAVQRAEHRRRGDTTPPNTPTSPAGVQSSADVPLTQPQHIDVNEVD